MQFHLCHSFRCIISSHSLEDRIVKDFFRRESTGCLCPPRQMVCTCGHHATLKRVKLNSLSPAETEVAENVRSRSAKIRAAEKLNGGAE